MASTQLSRVSNNDVLIAEILKHGSEALSEAVPDDIAADLALANVSRCTNALGALGKATSLIGAWLGRHMAVIATRPDIYEAAGYTSANDYEKGEIIGKISHGALWTYRAIAVAFPQLAVDEVVSIGSTNLGRAALVCKRIGANEKQREQILVEAAKRDTKAFKQYLEQESGLCSNGETSTASFEIIGSAAEIGEIKALLADEGLIAKVGLGSPRAIDIILAALQSFSAEEVPEVDQDGQPLWTR